MSFQIKENRHLSVNKTIRFPINLINDIEAAISGKNVTFSHFVIQACEFALENLDDEPPQILSEQKKEK